MMQSLTTGTLRSCRKILSLALLAFFASTGTLHPAAKEKIETDTKSGAVTPPLAGKIDFTGITVLGIGGGTPPTGTGFRHVTGGAEDGASKLVFDADISGSANISQSKLNLAIADAQVSAISESKIINLAGDLSSKLSVAQNLGDLSSYSSARDNLGLLKTYNVKSDFGAKGNGIQITDAVMTSGQITLTSGSNQFTPAMATGHIPVVVAGAGSSGSDLVTTIQSYTNAGSVTLLASAGSNVTGATATFGTDDAAAIQSAVNAAGIAGGTVTVPDGIYMIAGALQTTGGIYNAQITLPNISRSVKPISIKIVGNTPPPGPYFQFSGQPPPTTGAILFSTVPASGSYGSVIGGPTLGSLAFSNVSFEATNLTIRQVNNPALRGISVDHIAAVALERVYCDTDVNTYALSQPSNSNGIAFVMPGENNNAESVARYCYANGYYTGFEINEHSELLECIAQSCLRAFQSDTANHSISFRHCQILQCPYGIYVTGPTYILDSSINFERFTNGGPSWMNPIADIYDPSNLAGGFITYHSVHAGVGVDPTLILNGGATIRLALVDSGTYDYLQVKSATPALDLQDSAGSAVRGFVGIDSHSVLGTEYVNLSSNRVPYNGAFTLSSHAASMVQLETTNGSGEIAFYTSSTNNTNPTEAGRFMKDGSLRATGYRSSDNTAGASATTGGLTFKNGLYVGGSISGGAGVTLQTNAINNASQTTLNLQNGTGTTASNPSAGNAQVNVTYGTASNTAAQGNDSRIVNALQPAAIGSTLEAWDADLDALAALSGTNTMYYRSAANTWSPVAIGGNMTFIGGTLNSVAGGSGTVTSVGVTTANGVSASGGPVTTSGNFTFTLGAITPTTVDGLTITTTTGTFTLANAKTLTVNNTLTLSGTDAATLNIGAGGALGSNAFTSTAYVQQTTTVAGHALSANVVVSDSDLAHSANDITSSDGGTATLSWGHEIEGAIATNTTIALATAGNDGDFIEGSIDESGGPMTWTLPSNFYLSSQSGTLIQISTRPWTAGLRSFSITKSGSKYIWKDDEPDYTGILLQANNLGDVADPVASLASLAGMKNDGSTASDKGTVRYNFGIDGLGSVQAVATSNIGSLSGTPIIDGYQTVLTPTPDRVLLANQTTGSQNGVWVIASGAWTRPTDYPSAGTFKGRFTMVNGGTVWANSRWASYNTSNVTIDTSSVTWAWDGPAIPGTGITKTNQTFSILYGTTSGASAQGNDTRFPASVTGLRKGAGAGSSDTAAVPGTDYAAAPSGAVNTPLFNNGAGGFTNGTRSGNTTTVATTTGTLTSTHCVKFDANGNLVDAGAVCGSGGGGDTSTNTTSSIDGQRAYFSGTAGKTLRRANVYTLAANAIDTITSGNAYVYDSTTALTANRVITMPAASSCAPGEGFWFVDNNGLLGTYKYTFTRAGSDTINGSASGFDVTSIHAQRWFSSDGVSNWTVAALTQQGNVFNGVNQLVQMDGSGNYPAANGSAITNLTIPTLNQNTTGSAASFSVSGQTGLLTVTGLTSTNRAKTVRDAADTILELGGSYTPTGTWTSINLASPVLGTPASGNLANCTGYPLGLVAGGLTTATTITDTTTPTTGGITYSAPAIGSGQVYRLVAWGTFTQVASGSARSPSISAYWGATQLAGIAVGQSLSGAGTWTWSLDMTLQGTSTTAITTSGFATIRWNSSTGINTLYNLTNTSTIVSSGAQTLDLKFWNTIAVATESWVVDNVKMYREQ
jgi:hypothetical protein